MLDWADDIKYGRKVDVRTTPSLATLHSVSYLCCKNVQRSTCGQ